MKQGAQLGDQLEALLACHRAILRPVRFLRFFETGVNCDRDVSHNIIVPRMPVSAGADVPCQLRGANSAAAGPSWPSGLVSRRSASGACQAEWSVGETARSTDGSHARGSRPPRLRGLCLPLAHPAGSRDLRWGVRQSPARCDDESPPVPPVSRDSTVRQAAAALASSYILSFPELHMSQAQPVCRPRKPAVQREQGKALRACRLKHVSVIGVQSQLHRDLQGAPRVDLSQANGHPLVIYPSLANRSGCQASPAETGHESVADLPRQRWGGDQAVSFRGTDER